DGLQSLREAVAAANSSPDANVITFAPGLAGTIALTGGQLLLNQPVTIAGPGAGVITVSGNNVSRIFDGDNNSPAGAITGSLSDLTLTQGNDGGTAGGGAIAVADDVLTLSGVVITGSTAGGGGGISVGSNGRLTMENSTVSGNTTAGSLSEGGGLYLGDDSVTLIRNSTISGNATVAAGGGIFATIGPSLTVEGSTISANRAVDVVADGGGICSIGETLVVRSSTISGNSAHHHGGGIAVE